MANTFLFLFLFQFSFLFSSLVSAGGQKATIDFTSGFSELIRDDIHISAIGRCNDRVASKKFNLVVSLQDNYANSNKQNVYVQLDGGPYLHGDKYSLSDGLLTVKSLDAGRNYKIKFYHIQYGAQSEIQGSAKFECPSNLQGRNINDPYTETIVIKGASSIPQNVFSILDVMLDSIGSDLTALDLANSPHSTIVFEKTGELVSYDFKNLVLGNALVAFGPTAMAGVVKTNLIPAQIQHIYRFDPTYGQILQRWGYDTSQGSKTYTIYDLNSFESLFGPYFEFPPIDHLRDFIVDEVFTAGPERDESNQPLFNPEDYIEVGLLPYGDSIQTNFSGGLNDNNLGILPLHQINNPIGVDVDIPGNDLTNFGSVLNNPSVSITETGRDSGGLWSSFISYFAPNNTGRVDHGGGGNDIPAKANLTLSSTSETSVTLNWRAINTSGLVKKLFYRDGVLIAKLTGHRGTLIDDNLQPGTVYVYKMKASNGLGSVSSTPLYARTANRWTPNHNLSEGVTYRYDDLNLTFTQGMVCRNKNTARNLGGLVHLGNRDPNQLAIANFREKIAPLASYMFDIERETNTKIICGENLPNPFALTHKDRLRPGVIYRHRGINVRYDGQKVCIYHRDTLDTPGLVSVEDYNPNKVHLTNFRNQLIPLYDQMWNRPVGDRACK